MLDTSIKLNLREIEVLVDQKVSRAERSSSKGAMEVLRPWTRLLCVGHQQKFLRDWCFRVGWSVALLWGRSYVVALAWFVVLYIFAAGCHFTSALLSLG